MSLEQAILEHAGAIRELVAAMRESVVANSKLSREQLGQVQTVAAAMAKPPALADGFAKGTVDSSGADTELEEAVQNVEAAANEESRKNVQIKMTVAPSDPKPDASGAAEPAATQAGAEPLSYEKDVKPVLIKLAGKCGKQALTDLIAGFGVARADKLDAKQLKEAKKLAEALIAKAG